MTTLLEYGLMNALLTTLLAVAVFTITRFWRNPHLAHFLWLVVLLKMVTPPLVGVPISLGFRSVATELAPATHAESDASIMATTSAAWQADSQPMKSSEASVVDRKTPLAPASSQIISDNVVIYEKTKALWSAYVSIVWLGGSFIFGLLACLRIVKFHRKLKETDLAGESVQRIGESVAKKLGLKHRPEIRITDGQLSPLVWPIGRPPTVVLPVGLVDELKEEQLRTIVAHEYAHIARRDSWVRWLEVLCTVLYWWNPILWLARKEIRQAEEFCCDALVMTTYPRCSHFFGESLLKVNDFLSGFPSGAPLLVSEMRGAGQMKRRIERILKEQTPPRLSRLTQGVLLVIALAILPLSAKERQGELAISDKNNEAASIGDIIEGLKANEQAVKSLVVTYQAESSYNFTEPGSGPIGKNMIEDDATSMKRTGNVHWEVMRDGRGRMTAKYLKTNIRFDGSKKTKQEEFVSTFDGTTGQFLTIISTPAGVVVQRNQHITYNFLKTGPSPFDFTTEQLGKTISTLLSEKGSKIIGTEEWQNRSVVVVELAPVVVREDYIYKHHFWIDTKQNFLVVRRQSYVQRGEGMPWGLHYQIDTQKHKEVIPGIWLPEVINIWNYYVSAEGQDFLSGRDHIEVSAWSVNDVLDASLFELEPESIDQIGEPISPATESDSKSITPTETAESVPAEDAQPGFRNMLVKTVDSQGRVVPQVGIYVNTLPEGPDKSRNHNYTTDEKGQVSVLVPDPYRIVRIWTQKEGYVPLFANWESESEYQADGGIIPEEFMFSLPSGTEIGGVVENDDGDPIEGAVVEVMLGNFINDISRRPVPSMWLAEVPGPGKNPCVTDSEGRWRLNNVPEGDEVFVRLKLTHPDYISDSRWGGLQEEQSIHMKAFREKSAILKMHRGVVVTGTVTDPTGKPVPNAVVIWGDDPYEQVGSQEVRTNAEGFYELQPLSPGSMNLTVVAPGYGPEMRTIDIQASGSPEDFQLEKGRLLRIRFIDEAGNPVPNVGVGIRGWRGKQSLYNHRHPNVLNTKIPVRTDSEGIYKWEWAPADEVEFSFGAKGYQTVDKTLVADNTEHTVKLSK